MANKQQHQTRGISASSQATPTPQSNPSPENTATEAPTATSGVTANKSVPSTAELRHAYYPKWMRSNRVGFLAAGFAIAAWAPIIPFIKERFILDEHGLGLLLLCVGAGSLFSSPLAGFLTSRLGCKIPIFGATITWACCIGLISVVNNIYLMAATLFVFGMSAVILEVTSNINGAMIEQLTGKTVMSGLHALYSLGGLTGSFGVTFILGAQAGVVFAASAAALFMLSIVLIGGRYLFNRAQLSAEEHGQAAYSSAASEATAAPAPQDTATDAATDADAKQQLHQAQKQQLKKEIGQTQRELPEKILQKRYVLHPIILMISFMLCVLYLTEGAMLDWSGVFLYEERGIDLEKAGYGYAAFAVMMTTFRFLGDRLVGIIGRRHLIVLGTITICCGFILSALVDHLSTNLICFALIGIGSSNVIPQLVSYVAKIKDVPMHISVTLVNSFGFTGVLVGPAIIGFVAHRITLPWTFVVLGVLVLTVTFLSFRYLRASRP